MNLATNPPIRILAIESSCDETACAVVEKRKGEEFARVISSVTATSLAKHKATKGIVPEVAAREQLKCILPVIEEALSEVERVKGRKGESFQTSESKISEDAYVSNIQYLISNIDYIAVTTGPGLVGSLLVGIESARALAMAWDKPMIPVNHIQAHPYANFIAVDNTQILKQVQDYEKKSTEDEESRMSLSPKPQPLSPKFPLLSWVISGGHTDLYLMKSHEEIIHLGSTVDDAAGECFDKCARVLGFDYPGGPFIEKLALELETKKADKKTYPPDTVTLPRPMVHERSFNLSFSGLKTAFLRVFNENKDFLEIETLKQMMAHELQEAITDMILKKTKLALTRHPEIKSIIVSGGVAANKRLKEKMETQIPSESFRMNLDLDSRNRVKDDDTQIPYRSRRGGTVRDDKNGLDNLPSLSTKQPSNQLTKQLTIHFPPLSLCTDNAAMIGAYAAFHVDKLTTWREVTLELR